jgi:hypothetical protein
MRRIGAAERRARLGWRHHLAAEAAATGVVEAAEGVVALHATDPASVYLAVWARTGGAVEVAAVERALYHDRALVRLLGMRRTLFVVPVDLLPVVHAACARPIAARERDRLVQFLQRAGVADDAAAWLREVGESTLLALASRGAATGAELTKDVPGLRERITFGVGKQWATTQAISPRVLYLLGAEGHIVRTSPRGSWISSQHRWVPMDAWLPGGVGDLPAEDARVALARRWLARFGPGTAADLKWWTGWTLGHARTALAGAGAVEVDLDGAAGSVLADDLEPIPAPEPWVAFLPALDPTVMGWAGRAWYLGDHAPALFDRSGNPGPTVWWDGRIVGGWAQRGDGEIAVRLLEDVGAEASAAVEAMAGRLRGWMGTVRVTPRFRTPLERELTA